jgi:hypothetical protein
LTTAVPVAFVERPSGSHLAKLLGTLASMADALTIGIVTDLHRSDLRRILERSGRVRVVFNGHLHLNHLNVIRNIPYVTVQSLIENVDDDAPGRAAATDVLVHLSEWRLVVRVRGHDPSRYQFEW